MKKIGLWSFYAWRMRTKLVKKCKFGLYAGLEGVGRMDHLRSNETPESRLAMWAHRSDMFVQGNLSDAVHKNT